MTRRSSTQDALAPDLLKKCVRHHLLDIAQPITLERIASGHFNASFFVSAGNRQLVLRIAPAADTGLLFYERQMMHQEPAIHRLLLERTTVPVPPVVAFDSSQQIIDRDFILMERLPGRPLSETSRIDVNPILRQVGESLAQVHAITAGQYGYLGEHHPMPPQDSWADAFRLMWSLLLEDIQSTGHYSADEAQLARALLDRHLALFDRPVPASLLHMDVWSQNILVDRGNLSGLIDWDRALWGDPEIEFAVLDYCGISEPAFWEGYGQRREQSPAARTRQIFYLLYEVQKYIVIDHYRKRDPRSALAYKRQARQLMQELGARNSREAESSKR